MMCQVPQGSWLLPTTVVYRDWNPEESDGESGTQVSCRGQRGGHARPCEPREQGLHLQDVGS